jgi:hypothetical protein
MIVAVQGEEEMSLKIKVTATIGILHLEINIRNLKEAESGRNLETVIMKTIIDLRGKIDIMNHVMSQ